MGWGDNQYGIIDVPPPNEDFVAVAAGFNHSLALRAYNTGVETPTTPSATPEIVSIAPNPAPGCAQIYLRLPVPSQVQLEIFDLAGRRVDRIAAGELPAGETSLQWDGLSSSECGLASGVYLIRLRTADGSCHTRSVVLIR